MAAENRRVKNFEDLHIFQEARALSKRIFDLTKVGPVTKDYVMRDQMRRAALSVVSNIAEGFERGTDGEFGRFLFIAKGSCGELRAQVLVGMDQKYWPQQTYHEITDQCRRLSAGISNLISYLKRSRNAE